MLCMHVMHDMYGFVFVCRLVVCMDVLYVCTCMCFARVCAMYVNYDMSVCFACMARMYVCSVPVAHVGYVCIRVMYVFTFRMHVSRGFMYDTYVM